MASILWNAGLADLVDGEVERVADGFRFTEGPLWFRDGSVLFQDLKSDRTHRLDPRGRCTILRENTGAANGQTHMPGGRVVFCEQNGRRVSTMNPDGGDVETLVESWSGARLNSPNDVVCHSSGLILFTDPPYGVAPEDRSLHFQGVYRLDPARGPGSLELIADDFERPNGLAFSPDERILYVCDTARYHVRALELSQGGGVRSRVFARMEPGVPGGPDGVKVDRDGRVYVAVALGIWVFEPSGDLLGVLELPARPSNLTFCDPDGRGLLITAVDAVYRVRLKVAGILPPFLP